MVIGEKNMEVVLGDNKSVVEKKIEVKEKRLMRDAVQHYFDGQRHREYVIQVPIDATSQEIKAISRQTYLEKIAKK